MSKSFRFIGTISVVALIFFSLQGEAIKRYAQIFKGKTEHGITNPSKSTKQPHVRLQCFTEKISLAVLPSHSVFIFTALSFCIIKPQIHLHNRVLIDPVSVAFPSLRGPPNLV